MTGRSDARVAVLWELEWGASRLSCTVYRHGAGLQLRVASPTAVIVREPFDLRPQAIARAQLLRKSLTRRGWREAKAQD